MPTQVRLEAVLRRERLVARVGQERASVRFLPRVSPDVSL